MNIHPQASEGNCVLQIVGNFYELYNEFTVQSGLTDGSQKGKSAENPVQSSH